MNIIKLMSQFGVSSVNLNGIICLKKLTFRRNGCTSTTLIGYQWMDWFDNFDDVLAIALENIPLIKLHYRTEASYLNVNKIDVICKSDEKLFTSNSRTFVEFRWLDWDETTEEIYELIEKARR